MAELRVAVDCHGCATKIKKKLEKLDDVEEVEIDMDAQKVTIKGTTDQETVLKAVRKMGKWAEPWLPVHEPYNTTMDSFNHHYGEQIQAFAYRANYLSYSNLRVTSLGDDPQHRRRVITQEYGINYYDNVKDYSMRIGDLISDDNPTSCSIM